jgi:hypothetical protein
MKRNIGKSLVLVAVLLVLATACKDRDAEKRIAQLEARLAELEGKKTTAPQPSTNPAFATPTPADAKPEGPIPTMDFDVVDHDFGTIPEGQIAEFTYKFKNNGQAPLIIQSAQGSCGCTVPEWSKDPIPVGGTGFVKAKFDSNGRTNAQNKTVTVTANTWPKQTVLKFKAMVTPKSVSDSPVRK